MVSQIFLTYRSLLSADLRIRSQQLQKMTKYEIADKSPTFSESHTSLSKGILYGFFFLYHIRYSISLCYINLQYTSIQIL